MWQIKGQVSYRLSDFAGFTGVTTSAFIHGPTALPLTGTISPALSASGFPLGVSSGTCDFPFDLTNAPGHDQAHQAGLL